MQILIDTLKDDRVSDHEKQSVVLAIASLPTPSSDVVAEIKDLISKDGTANLILAYGSLAGRAESSDQQKILKFIQAKLPSDPMLVPSEVEAIEAVWTNLNALGNTKLSGATDTIIDFTKNKDETISMIAIRALRYLTPSASVQTSLIDIVKTGSFARVEASIAALRVGSDYERNMKLDTKLKTELSGAVDKLKSSYLQQELDYLYTDLGISKPSELRRRRRETEDDWAKESTDTEDYDIISPQADREEDLRNFPTHKSFLWSKTVGKSTGDYQIYLKSAVGLFAGGNICRCNFKVFGKGLVRGHALGWQKDAINFEGYLSEVDNKLKGKLYFQYIDKVMANFKIDEDDETFTYQLPEFKATLLNLEFTFHVYVVPVTLKFSIPITIGGVVEGSLLFDTHFALKGTADVTPKATAKIEASAAVNLLVSL